MGDALAELDGDKRTVGAVVDGQMVDFWHRIEGDCDLLPVKSNTEGVSGSCVIRLPTFLPKPSSLFSPKHG